MSDDPYVPVLGVMSDCVFLCKYDVAAAPDLSMAPIMPLVEKLQIINVSLAELKS